MQDAGEGRLRMIFYGDHVTVDYEGDEPPYRQVAALIRARIKSGDLEPGRPVPSVTQLCQTYGIARNTALKALGVLRDEGLVRTVKGWGTYVTRPEDRQGS